MGPAAPRLEGTSGFKALRIMRITRIMKAPALCGWIVPVVWPVEQSLEISQGITRAYSIGFEIPSQGLDPTGH